MTLDVPRETIFVTLAGSQAHGTSRAGSDVDLRGVWIVPLRDRISPFRRVEEFQGIVEGALWNHIRPRLERHPSAAAGLAVKTECVLFDVAKFVGLCAAANPKALEILFADENDWLFETPTWRRLHQERHRFLTMKVRQTFLGYAMAQLKRIQTHRGWLLNPPRQRPGRREFGLPDGPTLAPDDRDRIEKAVAEKVRAYALETVDLPKEARIAVEERLGEFWRDAFSGHLDDMDGPAALRTVAMKALGLPRDVAEALEAERRYRAAARHWEAFEAWKAGRNPVRADLERRHGYDTKHAMHLLRLMRTGLEALESGELRVRRPDAEELNAIRDGAMTFDELLHEAGALREKVEEAAQRSALPLDVDHGFAEGLLEELVARRVSFSVSRS